MDHYFVNRENVTIHTSYGNFHLVLVKSCPSSRSDSSIMLSNLSLALIVCKSGK